MEQNRLVSSCRDRATLLGGGVQACNMAHGCYGTTGAPSLRMPDNAESLVGALVGAFFVGAFVGALVGALVGAFVGAFTTVLAATR